MSLDVLGLPNQPIRHAAKHARLHSIASLTGAALTVLCIILPSPLLAQAAQALDSQLNQYLPPLGNTPQGDRLMLREISDVLIFTEKEAGNTNSAALQTGVTDIAARSPNEPIAPPVESSSVWQFVQQSRRLDIPDNKRIRNYRQQYEREAIWITKILQRATPFAGHIVEALDERFLPVELALLPAIESGYQPGVHSAEKAAGIWQIVPVTAGEIGLQRTMWFDGRADIIESTVAAIDYLSYLNAEFHGDWLLTLAAYNAGPGRVRSAISRNVRNKLPQDFWSLRLPGETREYVPKFLALLDMLRNSRSPHLEIPVISRGKNFEVVDVGYRASLDKVADATGIAQTTLRRLNAALVHGVTPPGGPHRLYVPLGQGQTLSNKLSGVNQHDLYTLPSTHLVVAGDSISTVARQYGLSQPKLREMNALDSSIIKIGQKLAVRLKPAPSDHEMEYVVTIGDSLSAIAQRFRVPLRAIKNVEGESLIDDVIHPGERLSIQFDQLRPG